MLQNLDFVHANVRVKTTEEKQAMKDAGIEPKPSFVATDQNQIEDLDDKYMAANKITNIPNFRLGWKDIMEVHNKKLDDMYAAMAKVKIDNAHPTVLHANDPWIKESLSKDGEEIDDAAAAARPGRNAMTLTRGGMMVEPLELAKQCCGRVNADGIPPWEDEDALRDTFCDVRFDVRPDPNKPIKVYHCLYTGKVFCSFCAHDKHKMPLPQFEMDPSVAEPQRLSFEAKEFLSSMPAPRITPVSKREEPEVPQRRKAVVEEDEEAEGLLEQVEEQLRAFPFCGGPLADTLFPGD
mmetsp:Transcript_11654/g.29085  ORF Transcript_11654/g.29085 Transcript_11654/m.29085 type:complete len:294 (+) Transcript_11654:1455-2336(+)